MGALLLQETFFDQGVDEPGGPLRVFPHGLNQIPHRESRGPRRALRIRPRIWRSESAKGACRWWWALLRLGLGAARLSMVP